MGRDEVALMLVVPLAGFCLWIASVLAPDRSSQSERAAFAMGTDLAGGYDLLRIALARFATDLQWPMPGAERRFSRWARARASAHAEAVAHVASGVDLANAIVEAASRARPRLGSRDGAVQGVVRCDLLHL